MILIAHRGNYRGSGSRENSPKHIQKAIDTGYEVEVDVWYINGNYYLGHDAPEYKGRKTLIKHKKKLWCHAKDGPTLRQLMKDGYNAFYNLLDSYVLTTRGFIWHYNGIKSIFVLDKEGKLVGYCSDDLTCLK